MAHLSGTNAKFIIYVTGKLLDIYETTWSRFKPREFLRHEHLDRSKNFRALTWIISPLRVAST